MSTPRHPSPSSGRVSSRLRAVRAENSTSRGSSARAIGVHDVQPLPIGARLGELQVARVIHHGDAGFVYLGKDRASLSRVAVKEYLPAALADRMANGDVGVLSLRNQPAFREGLQAFLDQSRILASLDEPALVKVLRIWEERGTAYMAMPLYEGATLDAAIRQLSRPSEAWLKAMLGPLLDGLAALHRVGCHPCDVTPKNVVVGDGGPLLFDVGMVRRILTRSARGRVVVHDADYAALEQHSRDPAMPEGPWTDIYAIAALLRRAITGKPPVSPLSRVDSDNMEPLSTTIEGYSAAFLKGIDAGLGVRPQQRPLSIAEFRGALGIRSLELAPSVPSHPPSASDPPAALVPVHASPSLDAPMQSGRPGTAVHPLASAPLPERAAQHTRAAAPESRSASQGPQRRFYAWVAGPALLIGLAGIGLLWTSGAAKKEPPSADRRATQNLSLPAPASAIAPREAATTPSAPKLEAAITPSAPKMQTATTTPSAAKLETAAAPALEFATTPALSSAGLTVPEPVAPSATPATVAISMPAPAKPTAAAPKTGNVQFTIRPWGEIVIDGKKRGVSPPLKEIAIPEGRHRIEIRNGTLPAYASDVNVAAGGRVSIAHSFDSQ